MDYSLKQKILMWICFHFGHKPANHWEHKGMHADCKRCHHVLAFKDGEYQSSYVPQIKRTFHLWLERNIGALRKPTHERVMTTYYVYIQWEGKLTGTKYHFVRDTLVVGESPEVIAKRNKEK